MDGTFARSVNRRHHRIEAGHRTHIDEMPPAPRDHAGCYGAYHMHGGLDIRIDRRRDIGGRSAQKALDSSSDSGIVDQNIDRQTGKSFINRFRMLQIEGMDLATGRFCQLL